MSDFDLIRQARQQYALEQRVGQTEVREVPLPLAARYKTAAGQSFATATTAIVNFGTPDFDTHSRVTTGAAWKFTANAAGYYGVAAAILWNGTTTWSDAESSDLVLCKNGVAVSVLDRKDSYGSTSTVYMMLSGTDTIYLVSGDYIDVRATQVTGGTLTLYPDATLNYINVWKL